MESTRNEKAGTQAEVEFLTVEDVGKILRVSYMTVIRRFAKERGVVDVGEGRKRLLRIPRYALDRFIAEHSPRPGSPEPSRRRLRRSLRISRHLLGLE